jgi:hypothetical protein
MHGTRHAAVRPSEAAMEVRLPSQLVLAAAQATAGTSAAEVSSTGRYSLLGTCGWGARENQLQRGHCGTRQ